MRAGTLSPPDRARPFVVQCQGRPAQKAFEKGHNALGVDYAQVGVHVDDNLIAQDRACVFGTNHTLLRRGAGIQQALCRQVGKYVCAGGHNRIAIVEIANQQVAILLDSGSKGRHVVDNVVGVTRRKDGLAEDKLVTRHRHSCAVCD